MFKVLKYQRISILNTINKLNKRAYGSEVSDLVNYAIKGNIPGVSIESIENCNICKDYILPDAVPLCKILGYWESKWIEYHDGLDNNEVYDKLIIKSLSNVCPFNACGSHCCRD